MFPNPEHFKERIVEVLYNEKQGSRFSSILNQQKFRPINALLQLKDVPLKMNYTD